MLEQVFYEYIKGVSVQLWLLGLRETVMTKYRIERDTMGEVRVPADKYWGAQTERSRKNFAIGESGSMPLPLIVGFAFLKKAAAYANCELGVLPAEKRDLICATSLGRPVLIITSPSSVVIR